MPAQLNERQRAFLTAPASELSPEAQVNGQRLHGHKPPEYELTEELPWHRTAAYLFACGTVTINDVAEAIGVHRQTIRNLLRQGWFQERVTELMSRHGGKDIMELFRAEQFNSLVTMIEVRDDPNASKRDRLTSAINILDRTMGRPKQQIEHTGTPISSNPVAEVAELEQRFSLP